MKKKWTIVSQIIAILLFAWSLFVLYNVTSRLNFVLRSGEKVSSGHLGKVFYIKYLIVFIALYGSIALMNGKKNGWMFTIIASVLYAGFMLVSARNSLIGEKTNVSLSAGYFGAAFAFTAMFILLVLKPFREKYKPTFRNWLFIVAIAALIIIVKNIW
jgi:hypothetical protein